MGVMEKSDVVIIGGVAVGPKTAATYIRRKPRAKVTLFQKEAYLSYASCGLPYFASGDVDSFIELTHTVWRVSRDAEYFKSIKGFTAIPNTEVMAIDRGRKVVTFQSVADRSLHEHGYDQLVIATGGRPAKPPFPVEFGERVRSFTRPEDAIGFRKLAERGQVGSVAIVGAGYIGCEMAEATASLWGMTTTLIEKEDHVLPKTLDPEMSALVETELRRQKIDLQLGMRVEKITSSEDGGIVHLSEDRQIAADFIIVCVGVVPETALAEQCGLKIGETGAILVDDHFRTSDPDIYAGGDCVELTHRLTGQKVYVPLGSLANRHGRIIAENLAGGDQTYPGVLGSFLVKVFDQNVGGVGLNSTAALRSFCSPAAVWGTFADRPEYYPESKTVKLKMIYDEGDGRLLGLQAVGEGDVARRIDVFATFLQFGATVDDLLNFEHGYAPPYAEAVDPLHHLAGMAKARERGTIITGPLAVCEFADEDVIWLDVREEAEQKDFPLELPGLQKFPLETLCARLGDLPSDRKIIIVCQRGSRAYQAAVFLQDAGFDDVLVLGGGRAMLG